MLPPTVPGTSLDDVMCALRVEADAEHDPSGSEFERLLRAIEDHVRDESSALTQYDQLATATQDPVVALVMRLILEDEVRHHGLLGRIAATVRDALYWTRSADALPPSVTPQERLPTELVALARALIEEEQAGARALRDLAGRQRGIDDGLDSLLLEMMALDSDKHARMLQFVQRRLARRSRG